MHIIIIEDNPETLGVLRDFFRSVDISATIQTYTSGNFLLDSESPLSADLLILGYDLGDSVTGTELLSYLEWSDHISAKTQVVFVSNTIEQAFRHAPLRCTQTRFYAKPVSLAHVSEILTFASLNRDYFSSVFYLVDKEKWAAAYNSLQLCKKGCPAELEEQALLLECLLLIRQGLYAKVLRRFQGIKQYTWAPYLRLRALAALGQAEKCKQLFGTYLEKEPYFSASLAVMNQLAVVSGDELESAMPMHLKDSDLSLFEYEFRAALLTHSGKWMQALSYLANKKKRATRGTHQSYFYTVAIVKNLCLELFKTTDSEIRMHLEKHLDFHAQQLQEKCEVRDAEIFQELFPQVVEALQSGLLFEQKTSAMAVGEMAEEGSSPFVYILRSLVSWLESGKVSVSLAYQCLLAIQKQGATSRAATNQLLLRQMLSFILPNPQQRAILSNRLGKMLFKAGRVELAAMTFVSGLAIHPENQKMTDNLHACMKVLDVRSFLGHTLSEEAENRLT